MKKFLLISGFCISFQFCLSQQKELDSLLIVYKNQPTEDTTKLKTLLDIVFDYSFIDPDKGIEKGNEAILLAKRLDNLPKLASAYNYTGVNYQTKGTDTMALIYFNKALETRKKIKDSLGIAKIFHNMGIDYFNLSDYPKALNYQQQSLQIFQQLHYPPGIAGDLNSIGVVYLSVADYPKALDYYFKASAMFEQMNREQDLAITFTNIGLVYDHLADYEKSLQYHFKALAIYNRNGNKNDIQKTLGNIGNCYDDANRPEQALSYYQKALQISENANFKSGIASAYSNMGAVYNKLSNFQQALDCSNKALQLYNESGNKLGLAFTQNQIGKIYLNMPQTVFENEKNTGNKYAKAIDWFNAALQSGLETGALDMQSETWHQLSISYEQQKKFDKALQSYKKYIVIQDSIINDKNKQAIARKEMQYEYDNKEALLNADHEKQTALAVAEINRERVVRNAVTWGAAILLLAFITSFIFYKRRHDAVEQRKDAELRAQISDTEMKALRAQMNPHFIFNSLNSISDYILKNNLQAADEYLTRFAKLMRAVLENSEKKEISLADDLKALELYIQLESLRLNNKFSYEIIVDNEIDKENTLVPPLILQPFVENSIWHGIAKKQGTGKIIITIKKEGEMMSCIVEDNGIGIQDSVPSPLEKKSLGMKITSSRIDIINKTKKTTASVKLLGLENGTRAEVKLPLQLGF